MELPLTGYPAEVLDALIIIVNTIANEKSVNTFYIGRSNNLDATKSRHGCDKVIPIYETNSPEHSLTIEDDLIKIFIEHPKNDNGVDDSRGNISEEDTIYVYVAVWYEAE